MQASQNCYGDIDGDTVINCPRVKAVTEVELLTVIDPLCWEVAVIKFNKLNFEQVVLGHFQKVWGFDLGLFPPTLKASG